MPSTARRLAAGEVAGCILHTDRGSQFRSRRFVRALLHHDMVGDNATMESFFALLQKIVLDRRKWATRQELRIASIDTDLTPATPGDIVYSDDLRASIRIAERPRVLVRRVELSRGCGTGGQVRR